MSETLRTGAVLYVCSLNSIRSPMAEFLTKQIFGDRLFVQSAGVFAGIADGFMQAVMAEKNIDLSNYEAKTIEEMDDSYFDLVITLSPKAHHRVLDWASDQAMDVEYWPTMDPSTVAGRREEVLRAYRETRDGLETKIRGRFG